MSGPWTILENSKTSNTGYITAKLGHTWGRTIINFRPTQPSNRSSNSRGDKRCI